MGAIPNGRSLEYTHNTTYEKIKCLLSDIRSALQVSIDNLTTQQSFSEKTMNAKFVDINDGVKVLAKNNEEIAQLKFDVTCLKTIISSQQNNLDKLEDRSRRPSLIIFGLPEEDDENSSQLKQQVVDEIFRTKLGVTAKTVERVHRLGRKRSDKPRPAILNFFYYNEKMTVLRNCFKLKNTTLSISHDYSRATLAER